MDKNQLNNVDEKHEIQDDSLDGSVEVPEVKRDAWDNKFQYLMAALGFAVGLGNIWRFPYLCKKNGGGAFLIPYVIMLVLLGYPLYYLELALGQKIRKGSIGVWCHINPYLGGIGFASNCISLLIGLYYTTILAWACFYFFNSFKSPLPWADCPLNVTGNTSSPVLECERSSPTDYFWYRKTLDVSDTIDDGFSLNWKMAAILVLCWFIIFLGLVKGIKSSGKVMYFATLFPYMVLTAFFIRGLTLDGAVIGVEYMFNPDLTRLADATVWREAATQIFFSLGLGYGTIIAYSSYNNKKNNCLRDALFVATANGLTSIFACVAVFSILGFKAKNSYQKCTQRNQLLLDSNFPNLEIVASDYIIDTNTTLYKNFLGNFSQSYIDKVVDGLKNCSIQQELDQDVQGPGLAFIAFAEAVLNFPGSNFWSLLFFFMLINIGISSEFGILQTVITTALDSGIKFAKWKITGLLCGVMCLFGLIFATRSGNYILDVFDGYSATLGLASICLSEVLAVSYGYGTDRLKIDIKEMVGVTPSYYWIISWKITTPLILIIILVTSTIGLFIKPLQYSAWNQFAASLISTPYPLWAIILIILLLLLSVLCIPLIAVLYWFKIFDPKSFVGDKNTLPATTDSSYPLTYKTYV